MNVVDLKEKLMQSKAYSDDEEFVKDILATTIEDRRKAEERRLERELELELARKLSRILPRAKTRIGICENRSKTENRERD
ncbi:hypothetical protein TNIN_192121 [Trichonephila inaurata madagascariensis]|uniref:Uncharacterized protein n=1 Tax=Trichonephila inaurata madagascariensis TaxID=2747483 RepID=A0A8X6MCV2_9ARAC|nr:hypothetical protein TNIN_192121 [Trichonephila inaurata madagascariensis]